MVADVSDRADERHEVGVLGRGATDECRLGRLLVLHRLTVLHVSHIDGAEPVDDGIHTAGEIEVATHGTLNINSGIAHGTFLQAVGDTS